MPRTGISSGTLRSVLEYGLPLHFMVNPPLSPGRLSSDQCLNYHVLTSGANASAIIEATRKASQAMMNTAMNKKASPLFTGRQRWRYRECRESL